MISLVCPKCQSRLNAKKELLGQTRRCPKCGTPVLIALPEATPPTAAEPSPQSLGETASQPSAEVSPPPDAIIGQTSHPLPDRLDRCHQYLICDRSKLIAAWKNDGQGWQVKTKGGLVSVSRSPEPLPNEGDFRLVELRLDRSEAGLHLTGLRTYQLAQRWALVSLERGDDPIVSKLTGPAGLNREQKNAVRQALKDQFMHEVWADAREVLDYLTNTDYHSPGAG